VSPDSPSFLARLIVACLAGSLCLALSAGAQPATQSPPPARAAATELKPFSQPVPAAAFEIELLPIPGDEAKGINPFYIGKTELTWEAFDVFVYRLDEGGSRDGDAAAPPASTPSTSAPDAISRPSKPYLPPDRGFGHAGYAAISMSYRNAQAFCDWLTAFAAKSAKPGEPARRYRLPTEAEWEHAAGAGASSGSGSGFGFANADSTLQDHAWFAANANRKPQKVASKKPNDWGLFDTHGNVAEWVTGRDGKPVLKGGSYLDEPDALKIEARQPTSPSFNASDPQMPKSRWWLADGPFIGFRIVCDPNPEPAAADTKRP
jgi:formylglycine-generating enzyme required for sulfatase activity